MLNNHQLHRIYKGGTTQCLRAAFSHHWPATRRWTSSHLGHSNSLYHAIGGFSLFDISGKWHSRCVVALSFLRILLSSSSLMLLELTQSWLTANSWVDWSSPTKASHPILPLARTSRGAPSIGQIWWSYPPTSELPYELAVAPSTVV